MVLSLLLAIVIVHNALFVTAFMIKTKKKKQAFHSDNLLKLMTTNALRLFILDGIYQRHAPAGCQRKQDDTFWLLNM